MFQLLLHACAEEDEEEEEETSEHETYTDEGDEEADADADADAGEAGEEDSGDDVVLKELVVLMDEQPAAATRSRAAAGKRAAGEGAADAFVPAATCHYSTCTCAAPEKCLRTLWVWELNLEAARRAWRLGFGLPFVLY